MSAAGSTAGSPTAAGATPAIDGAEIARRMVEATEAASSAAKAAAEALKQWSAGGSDWH